MDDNRLTLVIGNKNYSSWSLRAWLLLRMLDIPFEEIRILLDTSRTGEEIARYSPAGRVPVLIDDGLHIWDSLAIAEYVAEAHPRAWPADREQRARARSIAAEMHSGFQDLRTTMPMNCRRRIEGFEPTPGALGDIERILALWESCRLAEPDGPWLFGRFSIADAMYAPVVMRFHTYAIRTTALLSDYMDTVLDCTPMLEWRAAAAAETEIIECEEVAWP